MDTAERFLDGLVGSFSVLGKTPKAGALSGFRKPAIRRLRRWQVKDFGNWQIFYFAKREGVEIVHAMHGARDIQKADGGVGLAAIFPPCALLCLKVLGEPGALITYGPASIAVLAP